MVEAIIGGIITGLAFLLWDTRRNLRKTAVALDMMIYVCEEVGTFKNGNTDGLYDEGEVLAKRMIAESRTVLEELNLSGQFYFNS